MKVGLVLPVFSGDASLVRRVAASAAGLGYDGIFAPDHLFPMNHPERPSLEPFTTLAAVAAENAHITVGTLVARVGLRAPGLLAKMAAGLDDMSGGRFVLGLGSGDEEDRSENEAFGISGGTDPATRRALLSETARAVKALFSDEGWQGGELTPEIPGPLLPPPARPGGPPVWIGGTADATVSLAAAVADGWNAWGLDLSAFARKFASLSSEASRAGRAVEATWAGVVVVGHDEEQAQELAAERRAKGRPDAWVGSPERLARFLNELAATGATWCILSPVPGPGREELIAERVLPAVER